MAEVVCVPADLAPPGSQRPKQLCHLHAQPSQRETCHKQKKSSHLCMWGHFHRVQLVVTLCTMACQASVGGHSPGKNTRVYWPLLVSIPFFRSTIFPAALVADSSEYLVLPQTLRPKQLHHLHTWPSQGQPQVLQGSLRSKPLWTNHMQWWK